MVCSLNGQPRQVSIRDRRVTTVVDAAKKADTSDPGQVAAPFHGVVTVRIAVGDTDTVMAGDPIATIEAMKMESTITAAIDGAVGHVAVKRPTTVESGDLIVTIAPAQ
ncbi:MAG: biotin/lipoyl-containing protein [Microbacteriaceae bacterium]